MATRILKNYVHGAWRDAECDGVLPVENPSPRWPEGYFRVLEEMGVEEHRRRLYAHWVQTHRQLTPNIRAIRAIRGCPRKALIHRAYRSYQARS